MKYRKRNRETGEWSDITYDEALSILLGTWKDNEMTRSMLTIPNNIQCMFSDIFVQGDDGMVLMSGLWNIVPDWAYNEECLTGWKNAS